MLTFRKVAMLAAFLLTVIYLLHSHISYGSSSSAASTAASELDPKSDGTKDSAIATNIPSEKDAARTYPPPKAVRTLRDKDTLQQPLAEMVPRHLSEALQYQFPYDKQGKFPPFIWQTWKTAPSGVFPERFRRAEASWSKLHPGFVHEVVTDNDALTLIKNLYSSVPDVVEAYEAMPIPVMKADFFRYLILLAYGGIYSDIDTTALKSTTEWMPDEVPRSTVGLIVGIEADPNRSDWKDWYSRRIQFCQWTIQAKSGHPVLREIVAKITEDALRMKKKGPLNAKKLDKSIMEFTGPAVWTDTIFDYLNNPIYFKDEVDGKKRKEMTWEIFTGIETAKKVGDVVVLPITSFSPGVGHMNAKGPDDPMAFVKHDFEGMY